MSDKTKSKIKSKDDFWATFGKVYDKVGVWFIVLLFFVIMTIASPAFLTIRNLTNLARQMAIYEVMAAGMAFALLIGDVSLSAGSILGVSGCLAGMTNLAGWPLAASIALALVVGAILGMFNGLLITKGKLIAFIATYGTQQIYRGLVYLLTGGRTMTGMTDAYTWVGTQSLFGIPALAYMMVIVAFVCWLIMEKTAFGRHIYATGGNAEAAFVCGINTDFVRVACHSIAGCIFGFGGFLLSSRIGSAIPSLGTNYEFYGIAAVVIGGISFMGGIGSVWGVIPGALVYALISNAMDLLMVDSFYQNIVMGAVVILAVWIDITTKSAKTKVRTKS